MARKSSTSRRKTSREYDDVPETGDVVTVNDDQGFDADLDVDEPPKKKTATKKKAAAKQKSA